MTSYQLLCIFSAGTGLLFGMRFSPLLRNLSDASHGSASAAASGTSLQRLQPAEIAILVRTGSGVEQRLVSHLKNDLGPTSPFQSYQIYSDYEHEVSGHRVIDALGNLTSKVMRSEEWDFYRQRKAILEDPTKGEEELADFNNGEHWFNHHTKTWGLDKYKFMPLMLDASKRFPNAKFFLSIDDDTYPFLENVRRWLQNMPHEAHFVIARRQSTTFGHWPMGWFVAYSKGIIDASFRDHPEALSRRFHDGAWKGVCCGDMALGHDLSQDPAVLDAEPADIGQFVLPQKGTPAAMRFNESTLCQPLLAFHKQRTPAELDDLWEWENDLWSTLRNDEMILQAHAFVKFIPAVLRAALDAGQARLSQQDWVIEEGSPSEKGEEKIPAQDEFVCEEICVGRKTCMAWHWSRQVAPGVGECQLVSSFTFGEPSQSEDTGKHRSGWMLDRFRPMYKAQWCS